MTSYATAPAGRKLIPLSILGGIGNVYTATPANTYETVAGRANTERFPTRGHLGSP